MDAPVPAAVLGLSGGQPAFRASVPTSTLLLSGPAVQAARQTTIPTATLGVSPTQAPRGFILGTPVGGEGGSGSGVTDYRVFLFPHTLLEVDATGLCDWGISTEESLGQPATASWTIQDREMGEYDFPRFDPSHIGVNFQRVDVEVIIIGQEEPVFRGMIFTDDVDLPVAFPWRFHKLNATDYQKEMFGQRLFGTPGGQLWVGPDTDGNYTPIDPRVYLSGSDSGVIGRMFMNAWLPTQTIDVGSFVYTYTDSVDAYVGSVANPQPPDRTTLGSVIDQMAALSDFNVQYWLDQALRLHYVALPRWWEQPEDVPDPLEFAPANIDNDNPDGISSIGCRNLGYNFDTSRDMHQFYVNGSLGFAYNGGAVKLNGTGWVTFGSEASAPSPSYPQAFLDAPESINADTKLAVAARADKSTSGGILRGHCTVGNERHHMDGWHVGQIVKITDARLPASLNERYYVIQKVTTKLIPTINWRVYDLEWGDAPIARSSSRRVTKDTKKVALPGRLWDIEGRIQNPLPSSTITVHGQLKNEKGEPVMVPDVTIDLELHVWDATGTPAVGVGSINPETVISDIMGRWQTQMTVGPGLGYSYCVCPVGSDSCHLPTT